jgi:hypothetical protein
MSSSIFNEIPMNYSIEDNLTKLKYSKKFNGKDIIGSTLNNLINTRDSLKKQNKFNQNLQININEKDLSNINSEIFSSGKKDENLPEIKIGHFNNNKKNNDNSQNFTTIHNLENSDFLKDDRTRIYNFNNNSNNNNLKNNINNNNINKMYFQNQNQNLMQNSNSNIYNNFNNLINVTNHSMWRSQNNLNNTSNWKNTTKFHSSLNGNYCPYCTHCNSTHDSNLDYNLNQIRDAKNIITSSFDYILKKGIIDSSNMNIFTGEEAKDERDFLQEIEILLNHNKKFISHNIKHQRIVNKIVAHFLEALVNQKMLLENVVSNIELVEKFEKIVSEKSFFMYKGNINKFFDDELEDYFDIKTKEKVRKFIRSKVIVFI